MLVAFLTPTSSYLGWLLQEPAAEALSKDSIAGLNQRLEALQKKGRERLINQVTAGQQEVQCLM